MVSLPKIEDWSSEQIHRARQLSPAVDRYWPLLQQTPANWLDEIRQQRQQFWLQAACATVLQTHSSQDICLFWSQAALQLLKKVWTHHNLDKENVCLVAMGKLGALELNLSSDIDLFFVAKTDVSKDTLRLIRRFISDLTEVRATGFCFRIDLNLRPGGTSSPLVIPFDQMTNHYGYHGETWERVAMIRQIVPLGPKDLAQNILEFCQKFAYRKHIDYNLFYDLYSLREKIQNHKYDASPWNLKFRKGGIRDLELLIHSLQLIHGGKHPSLVTSSTPQAIESLEQLQFLSNHDAQALRESYWFFRTLENKIQSENDQHTYEIGASALITDDEKNVFVKDTHRISTIVDQLLKPYQTKIAHSLHNLEFKDPSQQELWKQLEQIQVHSRSKLRDEEEKSLFLQNVHSILHQCTVDPAMALRHLHDFLMSIKAKTSFFTLLNQHRELLEELLWIFSCSPFLSQILIHRPELIDSFLLKKAPLETQDEDSFYSTSQDFKLLSDLISSSQFLRHRDIHLLLKNLTQTTDTIVEQLLLLLQKKWPIKVSLLTLGKWAAQEMGLTSDLDFIFLTKEEPSPEASKLARRFIHFLSSPHSGHTLYQIDLRLRPSGSAGPLLLTKEHLKNYLNDKAEIWERQAYLCSRQLPASSDQEPLFFHRSLTTEQLQALGTIQQQLLSSSTESIDLKKNRGGLLHTELTLQIAALEKQVFPATPNVTGLCAALAQFYEKDLCVTIKKNYFQLRTHQQLLILLSQSSDTRIQMDSPDTQKLASLLQTSPKVLFTDLQKLLSEQKSLLNKLDPLAAQLKI